MSPASISGCHSTFTLIQPIAERRKSFSDLRLIMIYVMKHFSSSTTLTLLSAGADDRFVENSNNLDTGRFGIGTTDPNYPEISNIVNLRKRRNAMTRILRRFLYRSTLALPRFSESVIKLERALRISEAAAYRVRLLIPPCRRRSVCGNAQSAKAR